MIGRGGLSRVFSCTIRGSGHVCAILINADHFREKQKFY